MPTGDIKNINVSGGMPNYNYQWYSGGTSIPAPNGTALNLQNVPMGTYNLIVTDANNCMVTSGTYTVNGSLAVIASFTANPATGTAPLNVSCTNTSYTTTNNYTWNFGNGITSNIQNPATTYTTAGQYTVTLIASNGSCHNTYSLTITVDESINMVVPNIFSPNGDNTNDEFYITSTGLITLNCEIYNRWGQKIYTIKAPNDKWDGKIMGDGNHAPDGTYFYILNASAYNGKEYNQQGFITLIR